MTLTVEAVLKQIDNLLNAYKHLSQDQPDAIVTEAIARLSDAIERLSPPNSRYKTNAQAALTQYGVTNSYNIQILVGILKALREDYANGYLQSFRELVHADIFADFLEMAEYLLSEGYKDPAAVIIGGVIEEHLRKLCDKFGILTTVNGKSKKADSMNSDLASANAYSKLDQKSITAWLDLRNKAAHGKYNDYSNEQVDFMLQGQKNFMSRNLA